MEVPARRGTRPAGRKARLEPGKRHREREPSCDRRQTSALRRTLVPLGTLGPLPAARRHGDGLHVVVPRCALPGSRSGKPFRGVDAEMPASRRRTDHNRHHRFHRTGRHPELALARVSQPDAVRTLPRLCGDRNAARVRDLGRTRSGARKCDRLHHFRRRPPTDVLGALSRPADRSLHGDDRSATQRDTRLRHGDRVLAGASVRTKAGHLRVTGAVGRTHPGLCAGRPFQRWIRALLRRRARHCLLLPTVLRAFAPPAGARSAPRSTGIGLDPGAQGRGRPRG